MPSRQYFGSFPNASPDASIVVQRGNTNTTSGTALAAACVAAATLTPGGVALSDTNIAQVLVPPGDYIMPVAWTQPASNIHIVETVQDTVRIYDSNSVLVIPSPLWYIAPKITGVRSGGPEIVTLVTGNGIQRISCTISHASPAVVAATSSFAIGHAVKFTTTGALPDPLSTGVVYFLDKVNANQYYIYDTAAHAIAEGGTGRVDTTSDGSGAHTLDATISSFEGDPLSAGGGDACTWTADTSHFSVGIQGGIVTPIGAGADIYPEVKFTGPTGYQDNGMSLYFPDGIPIGPCSAIGMEFYVPPAVATKVIAAYVQIFCSGSPAAPGDAAVFHLPSPTGFSGDCLLYVPTANVVPYGSPWGLITRLTVYFRMDNSGGGVSATIKRVFAVRQKKAIIILGLDGPYQSGYDYIQPRFSVRGWPFTLNVNPAANDIAVEDHTPLNRARMTTAGIIAASKLPNVAVSTHSWRSQVMSGATVLEVINDQLACTAWMRCNNIYDGTEWRGSTTQDDTPNVLSLGNTVLASLTGNGNAHPGCWPPINRLDIPDCNLISNNTEPEVIALMDRLVNQIRGFTVVLMHGVSTDRSDTPTAVMDRFMTLADTYVQAGLLEFVTMSELLTRSGILIRDGIQGGSIAERNLAGVIGTQNII